MRSCSWSVPTLTTGRCHWTGTTCSCLAMPVCACVYECAGKPRHCREDWSTRWCLVFHLIQNVPTSARIIMTGTTHPVSSVSASQCVQHVLWHLIYTTLSFLSLCFLWHSFQHYLVHMLTYKVTRLSRAHRTCVHEVDKITTNAHCSHSEIAISHRVICYQAHFQQKHSSQHIIMRHPQKPKCSPLTSKLLMLLDISKGHAWMELMLSYLDGSLCKADHTKCIFVSAQMPAYVCPYRAWLTNYHLPL